MPDTDRVPRATVHLRKRPAAERLMMLRVQLFTAMQMLEGEELDDFWKLLEEVQACRG